MRRALFLNAVLCLFLPTVLAARQSATAVTAISSANILGSWKQLPPDDPTTTKVEPEGDRIKFSFACKQDNSCPEVIVANYDGKPYKQIGNAHWESSFRKTGEGTIQEDGYLSGKLDRTGKWQLSSDGNTLTRTYHIINSQESKDLTYVADRSGGPVSSNDPFIGTWKRNWDKSDELITTYALKGDVLTFSGPDGVSSERNCDGKDHRRDTVTAVLYSCRFPDPYTYELVAKENEKVAFYITRRLSDDGKRMVATTKDPEGKTTGEVTYERVK